MGGAVTKKGCTWQRKVFCRLNVAARKGAVPSLGWLWLAILESVKQRSESANL